MKKRFNLPDLPEWVPMAVLGSVGSSLVIYVTYRIWKRKQTRRIIKERGDRARAACKSLLEKTQNMRIDSNLERKVLQMTATELQQALKKGQLKSTDVLAVYQKRAMEVNEKLNCVIEPIREAEALAVQCDKDEKKQGLLHGIPVSFKENLTLKGYDSTLGLKKHIDVLTEDDCVLVKVVKSQGGIPFVRTNLPQTMLSFDNSNPIYGATLNPHDHTRTSGGSSGGEGSLIGGGGSIIGVGNDIAGSIRIPCHFCGVYGMKPTVGRLSFKGNFNLMKGQNVVRGSCGPMARDMDGVILLFRAFLTPALFKLDQEVVPIPFRNEIFEDRRKLKIGYYVFDGYSEAVPACKRAVRMAKAVLENNGHQVVEFKPPRVPYGLSHLYFKAMSGDGAKTILDYLEGDIVDPGIATMVRTSSFPNWFRKILSYAVGWISNDPVLRQIMQSMIGCRSVQEWWQLTKDVLAYRDEFHDAWTKQELDAVICPGFGFTAPPYGHYDSTWGGGTYTPLYNLLNYPAGIVPIAKVNQNDMKEMENYPTDTLFRKGIKKATVGSEGLPVGVQIVGLPWAEELVLRVMKEVDDGAKLLQ